jgi:hypothetical protein
VTHRHSIPIPPGNEGKKIPSPDSTHPKSTIHEKVVFSFELFDGDAECPSEWGNEIKSLFSSFRKASEKTWYQVFQTGGKEGRKTGLGYTTFKKAPFKLPATLSPDVTIAEMRATEKARFFGTKIGATFFVMRLDRTHQICTV